MGSLVTWTELEGIPLVGRGKVRDIYELPEGLLIIATDRLSAFDVIFNEGVPGKGFVTTALSEFWFGHLASVVENHVITTDVSEMPEAVRPYEDVLRGRTMLVKKARVFPVECVVRGYLAGSGFKDYVATGSICGIELPAGLELSSRLPETVFTPATKAQSGHDENISFEQAAEIVGREDAERLRETTLAIYRQASEYLAGRGILLCDTKFEFGLGPDGEFLLVDEVLTPDSSRFWDRETYTVGVAQDSFDKQIVRDYLLTLDWDRSPPPPPLPAEVTDKTSARYIEIARRITGRTLEV